MKTIMFARDCIPLHLGNKEQAKLKSSEINEYKSGHPNVKRPTIIEFIKYIGK